MSETVINFRREPAFVRERFNTITRRGSEYLVKGLLPAQGVGFLAGPSGSFKSFLALDWCLTIPQGLPILGRRTHACGVVYVAAEAPNGVRKRVEAWRQTHAGGDLPFELIGQAPDLRSEKQMGDLAAELRVAADEMMARGHRLGLVVIDTLAASMPGGDENTGVDMSAVLSNAARLGDETGAFILIISHTGKDETRGLRGWSGQFAGADCVIMLTREEGDPRAFGRVAKLKDGEDGQRFALRLERVVLGLDDDGDEVSSAVVAYEDAPETPARGRKQRPMNAGEKLVFDAVGFVTDHGQTCAIPSSVPGVKPWMKAVTRAAVRVRAMASGFAFEEEKAPSIRQRFGRALQGLAASGKVRVEGELIWLIDSVTA